MVGTFFSPDFWFFGNRHRFLLYRNKFLGQLRHFEDISFIFKRIFKDIEKNVKNKETIINRAAIKINESKLRTFLSLTMKTTYWIPV